ncbi:Putative acyltransferase [Corynebacterium camporealensis]|uniref:Putative acyltransferase n=1 Tax=Corynebacterium camporealensis TaxID=161896 RepID=A0A0F6TBI8_9CORY|nr:acyltransferase family protein [Corynebacterium camporealensis]AKE39439.1 putative acyltransferase [Corynebacterium camporealensis]AVH88600.1 Putative acyltransferase [Corynebacterium camporealensis]
MTKESPRNFRYRYDLDGLRGIAIGLVVIYHVFVGRVSGGVDVFLLLSGYFFLGSQLRYAGKPNASLNPWWPIWRTLRRLVPALVLTVGVTYLLVRFITPQQMRDEFTSQITASLLYFQNWELASQDADYAAASASTSPLQHLWSMSVQGQFYLAAIVFALILAAVMRLRPSTPKMAARRFPTVHQIAGPILIVVTIASFIYASRFGLYGTPDNYYSTFSRAWELTLGAVLAIYGAKLVLPSRLADVATGFGMLCLIFTGALIADSTAYPGPLSLLPLGGAVLIILGGGGRISKAMASKQARWLGDIAYPLYLWHWPLLIVSTVALEMEQPTWWLGIIIVLVSLVLADLTHRFIEKPLRQHRKRPLADDLPVNRALSSMRQPAGAFRAAGGVLVGICVIAVLAIQPLRANQVTSAEGQNLDPQQYPGVMAFVDDLEAPEGMEVKPDPILVGGIMPPVATQHCFVAEGLPADFIPELDKDGNPCIFGDPDAEKTVYLVGGSHAEQWASPLDKLGKEMGFKLVPMLRQACPIELGPEATVTPECAEWGQLVTDRIVEEKPDLVVSNTTRPQGAFGHGPDLVPAGYVAFWDVLAENDIPFMGFRDNPWGFDGEGAPVEFDECYIGTEDAVGCGMRAEQVYEPVDPGSVMLANYENMLAIDTAPWFCNAEGECPVVIGNIMAYRDMHHISNALADSAKPLIADAMRPFLEGERVQQQMPALPDEAPLPTSEPAAPPVVEEAPEVGNPVPYPGVAAGTAV